jgi:cytochrome P450
MLLTCDVHLVKQVLGQAHDFHAPVEVLSLYNLYGPTLAASEGEQWRLYRKITTPFFNQKTYGVVWRESLEKSERVSTQWSQRDTRITDVKGEIMSKLNLRVIAKIFYNQELEYDRNDAMKDVAPSGHQLTFSEAINAVLSNLATIFGLPKWLLGSRTDNVARSLAFADLSHSQISFQVAPESVPWISRVATVYARNARLGTVST